MIARSLYFQLSDTRRQLIYDQVKNRPNKKTLDDPRSLSGSRFSYRYLFISHLHPQLLLRLNCIYPTSVSCGKTRLAIRLSRRRPTRVVVAATFPKGCLSVSRQTGNLPNCNARAEVLQVVYSAIPLYNAQRWPKSNLSPAV
jgi:hypothetical protein